MNKLSDAQSDVTTLRAIRFLRARLGRLPRPEDASNPNTPEKISAECATWIGKIRDAFDNDEELTISRMSINADLQRACQVNYKLLQTLSRDLLFKLEGDSQAAIYVRLFPKSPSDGAGANVPYTDQIRFTKSIVYLLETDPAFEAYAAYRQKLADSISNVATLLEKREQVQMTIGQTKKARDVLINDAKEFYNKVYYRLLAIYEGESNMIEDCFMKISKAKKKAKDEDDEKSSAEA